APASQAPACPPAAARGGQNIGWGARQKYPIASPSLRPNPGARTQRHGPHVPGLHEDQPPRGSPGRCQVFSPAAGEQFVDERQEPCLESAVAEILLPACLPAEAQGNGVVRGPPPVND